MFDTTMLRMVRLRTLFCATLVFLCTHALSPIRGNDEGTSSPPPSPPPLNKFGKKIPVPEDEFLNLICQCLREDPVKGNCPEVGYTERNSDGDIYGVLSHWDTSEITDMSTAFSGDRLTKAGWTSCDPVLPSEVKESFNPDFSLWDTSSVTDFSETFTIFFRKTPNLIEKISEKSEKLFRKFKSRFFRKK